MTGKVKSDLFENNAGMSKKEMAAFYLEKDDTIELVEEPRKLTKPERDH